MSDKKFLNWTATNGDTLNLEVPASLTDDELAIWAARISLLVDIEMRDPNLIPFTEEALSWARAHYQTPVREA